MGEHYVTTEQSTRQKQSFMRGLLTDLAALEQMLEANLFEIDHCRIGAEQEMFLVDRAMQPALVAMQLLAAATESRLTTEIGQFNLEANLTPRLFQHHCLSEMEHETRELIGIAREAASKFGAEIVLAGILPTLRQTDLSIHNLTPHPRYVEMNHALCDLRGSKFNVHIKGIDELSMTHDNLMLEACCTSFQMHLQTAPRDFAQLYNFAQLVTAPVLAAAGNSPLLFGHRLWHETRIALFQHSTDERSVAHQLRNKPTRVSFGDGWIKESVTEIFREEIARYRILLTKHIEEDALAVLAQGKLPRLDALRLHNGTVWRWNRPCYGVTDGKPHLRIEMRAIPAGPTVSDEIANAAFFLGLMCALPDEYGDITEVMLFDDVKDNFHAAARLGLKAPLTWVKGEIVTASALILDHLLPLAKQGLLIRNIAEADIERYLGIIEERVKSNQTGSQWALRSFAEMDEKVPRPQRLRSLTASMLTQEKQNLPVHLWRQAELTVPQNWRLSYQTVGQIMSTDLFTVRPDDLIDLAASVMDWKHVRHVPVESDTGELIGIVSHRDLLHWLAQGKTEHGKASVSISDIMHANPITVTAETSTLTAIKLMREHRIGCLPVLEGKRLVGLITAQDFLNLTTELIEQQLGPTNDNV